MRIKIEKKDLEDLLKILSNFDEEAPMRIGRAVAKIEFLIDEEQILKNLFDDKEKNEKLWFNRTSN